MAKDTRPSLAQESSLRDFSLEPLPTAASTKLLIDYINMGNGAGGVNESERVKLWSSSCKNLVGKRVVDRIYAQSPKKDLASSMNGTIEYLIPRSQAEVRMKRLLDTQFNETMTRAPFKLYVKWDSGKGTVVAISSVKIEGLVEEEVVLSDKPYTFDIEHKKLYVANEGAEHKFALWHHSYWHINRYGHRGDCAQEVVPQSIFEGVFAQFKVWALKTPDVELHALVKNGTLCRGRTSVH